MVTRQDVLEAAGFAAEIQSLQAAKRGLEGGGRITSMTVGGVTISTVRMEYPPQMAQAISGMLDTQIDELYGRLEEMGIQRQPEPEEVVPARTPTDEQERKEPEHPRPPRAPAAPRRK